MKELKMTSAKSYMIRAFCEWIADNNDTPSLIIDKSYPQSNLLKGREEVKETEEVYILTLPIELLKTTIIGVDKTIVPFPNNLDFSTNAIVAVISEKYKVMQRFQIEPTDLELDSTKKKTTKPTLTIVK